MSESESERLNIIIAARDREFARTMDRVTRRLQRLESEGGRALGNTARAWDRVGQSATRAGGGLTGVMNISSSGRFVLQNTAAQLGDIAVQLESGTAASRVMAQQLPQIFGGFGALGGALGVVMPLLGTLAAVGIPIVATLVNMSRGTEEAAEEVRSFEQAVNDALAAVGRADAAMSLAAAGGAEDLGAIYGEVTARVQDLADRLADIERRAAVAEVNLVLEGATGDNLQAELDRLLGSALETQQIAIELQASGDAAEEIALMREQIREAEIDIAAFTQQGQEAPPALVADLQLMRAELAALEGDFEGMAALSADMAVPYEVLQSITDARDRLEAARQAGDFIGIADALADMRAQLEAAGAAVSQSVLDGLTQAEDVARQMAEAMGQAANAAGQIGVPASAIDPAAQAAVRLAAQLGIALDFARQIAAVPLSGAITPPGALPGTPVGPGPALTFGGSGGAAPVQTMGGIRLGFFGTGGEVPEAPEPETPGRSRGGGGAAETREATAALEAYNRALERMQDAYAGGDSLARGYIESLQELRAQYDAGEIDSAEFEASLQSLGERFEQVERAASQLRNQAAETFADILLQSRSAEEAIASLLSQWARLLAQSAFRGLFNSGAGGGFFNFLGGLISMEGGGYLGSAHRSGGIDGKGGFLMIGHPQETVIDHTRHTPGAASGGGGGDIHITVQVSGARGNAEITEMVQKGVSDGLSQYDRHILPQSVRKISRDPRRIG